MSSKVEPHEAEAIRELLKETPASSAGEVIDRDFHHPRRLGSVDFAEFTRRFQLQLPDIEAQLSADLNGNCPLEWGSIGELNSRGLFEHAEGPFAAIVFEVLGQPAWIMWQNVAAINATEKILGSAPDSTKARRLTGVEVSVLESLLSTIADGALRALGLEGSNLRVAQTLETLGSWLDATGEADPHRLHIELAFAGPREASSFHIYIPAPPQANLGKPAQAQRVDLPGHLDEVNVDVSVTLGGCEVRLKQLLELEVGDVVPLDTRIGEFATFNVEGRPHAQGVLGQKQKQIAIRIEQLTREQS